MTNFEGLNYPIRVDDQFSQTLEKFRSEVDGLISDMALAKQGLEDAAVSARTYASGIREAGSGSRGLNRSLNEITTSAIQAKGALTAEQQAAVEISQTLRRNAVELEKEAIARREGINLIRLKARGLTVEEEALQKVESATRKLAVARQAEELAQQRGITLGRQKVAELTAEEEARRRIAAQQRRSQVSSALAAQGFDEQGRAQVQGPPIPKNILESQRAQLQFEKELSNLRVTRQTQSLKQQSLEYQALAGAVDRARKAKSVLGTEIDKVTVKANRALFTFRRLIGIFATFAIARNIIQGFQDLVATSIRFNSVVETSRLSIGALISAVGEVKGPLGQNVSAAEQFTLAQKLATRQTNLLRAEALKTSATFEELSQAFQTAIAPGLTAGLNLDEIRRFTISISQAATTLKLEQSQLAEEIRAVLAGTIQPRNTRIATSLGITNDDIKRAKEAGKLAEFLESRFAAFGVAANESTKTFNVALANTKDALANIIGTGALRFFENLRKTFIDISKSLVSVGPGGILSPDPQAVALVSEVSRLLEGALESAKRVSASLKFDDALAIVKTISELLSGVVTISEVIASSFVKAAANVTRLVQGAAGLVSRLSTSFGLDRLTPIVQGLISSFGELFATTILIRLALSGWSITLVAISKVVKVVAASFGILPQLLAAIRTGFVALRSVVLLAFSPIGVAVGIFAGLVFLANRLVKEITGVDLRLGTVLEVIRVGLVGAFKFLGAIVRSAWGGAVFYVSTLIDGAIDTLNQGIFLAQKLALSVASVVSESAEKSLAAAEATRDAERRLFAARQQARKQELEAAQRDAAVQQKAASEFVSQGLKDAIANNESATTFADFFKKLGVASGSLFTKAFGESANLEDPLKKAGAETRTLSEIFGELPGIIDTSRAEINSIADAVKEVNDAIRKSANELAFARQNVGISQNLRQQAQELNDAQFTASEKLRTIDADRLRTARTLIQAQGRLNEIFQTGIGLSVEDQRQVVRLVELGRSQLELSNQISEAKTAQLAAETRLADARQNQNDKEAETQRRVAASAAAQVRFLETAQTAIRGRIDQFEGLLPTLSGSSDLIKKTAAEILALQGQELAAQEQLKRIDDARKKLSEGLLENARLRVQAAIQEALFTGQRELASAQLAAEVAKANLAAVRSGSESQQRLTEANNRVAALRLELSLLGQKQVRDRQALQNQLQVVQGTAAELDLKQQLAQFDETSGANLEQQIALLQTAEESARRLQEQVNGTFGGGLAEGVKKFAEEFGSAFQAAVRIANGVLTETAGFLSQLVVDAFDPTQKVDLRERFGRFFQSIARMMLDEFIKLGISKIFATSALDTSAVSLGTASASLAFSSNLLISSSILWTTTAASIAQAAGLLLAAKLAGGGVGGAAQGGKVPSQWPIRGLAAGGGAAPFARPSYIPKSDTIPAWLTPGEHVIRVPSVQKYGDDFLDLVNRGLLDKGLVRALVASSKPRGRASAAVRKMAYAAGGGVSTGGRSEAAFSAPSSSTHVVATIVADDSTMARLHAGGSSATMKHIKDHKAEYRAILGINN